MNKIKVYVPILFLISLRSVLTLNVTEIINPVRFPYGGPFIGLFLAIAIPLDLPNYNVFVSYNLEANYNLPQNESTYSYPPDVTRSFPIDRKYAYTAIEQKMKSHGYPGRNCLLRAICEAAEYSMQHNGVLADILHIILTPSSSRGEGLSEYEQAEKYGKDNEHCDKYQQKCGISLLDVISTLEHAF